MSYSGQLPAIPGQLPARPGQKSSSKKFLIIGVAVAAVVVVLIIVLVLVFALKIFSPPFSYLGCYNDKIERVFPVVEKVAMTVPECSAKAKIAGFKKFGLQWNAGYGDTKGICWYGNDAGYDKYGTATNCTKFADGYTNGSDWTLAVYKNK